MSIKSTLICAAMLAVAILSARPALAASLGTYEVTVKRLVAFKYPSASAGPTNPFGASYSTHFQTGDMVGIMCEYIYLRPKTEISNIGHGSYDPYFRDSGSPFWTIGLYIDGQRTLRNGHWLDHWRKIGNTVAGDEVAPIDTTGMAIIKWRATPGHHTVRCVLNENHEMRDINSLNNEKSISIDVKTRMNAHIPLFKAANGPSKPMALNNGNMAKKHGLNPLPNAHIRKCRPSVSATSRIDANQFFGQYGPTTKVPESHFTLYLNKVEAINDSLFCSYTTRAGNAKTTVEISCKGARLSDKASNAYYCQ